MVGAAEKASLVPDDAINWTISALASLSDDVGATFRGRRSGWDLSAATVVTVEGHGLLAPHLYWSR